MRIEDFDGHAKRNEFHSRGRLKFHDTMDCISAFLRSRNIDAVRSRNAGLTIHTRERCKIFIYMAHF
jgi:hypothetical protein